MRQARISFGDKGLTVGLKRSQPDPNSDSEKSPTSSTKKILANPGREIPTKEDPPIDFIQKFLQDKTLLQKVKSVIPLPYKNAYKPLFEEETSYHQRNMRFASHFCGVRPVYTSSTNLKNHI